MANIQHKDILEANLHEVKGASTSSTGQILLSSGAASTWGAIEDATGSSPAGSLLVSDGAASGNFVRYQGWGQYTDSRTTVGTPTQNIATGATAALIVDGLGSIIEKLPSDAGATPLWNVATNKHDAIALHDTYHLRFAFTAENYGGATPYLDLELNIGGAQGIIYSRGVSLRKAGAAQAVSMAFPVFSGATYLANGAELLITFTGTGSCDIYNTSVLIIRESKNYV